MEKELQKEYKKSITNLVYIILLMVVFVVGATLNLIVISGNHGRMPIYYDSEITYCNDYYITFNTWSEVRYAFLSDIIPIDERLASIGDVLIVICFPFLLIVGVRLYKSLKLQKRLENETS